MFITEFVRNVAWSLRNTAARRAQRDDSVLPADAVAPVAPVRGERERKSPQELAAERVFSRRVELQGVVIVDEAPAGNAAEAPATAPEAVPAPAAGATPHIDIKV